MWVNVFIIASILLVFLQTIPPVKAIREMAAALRSDGAYARVQAVTNAKVPIVKLLHRQTGVEIEYALSLFRPPKNPFMIIFYCHFRILLSRDRKSIFSNHSSPCDLKFLKAVYGDDQLVALWLRYLWAYMCYGISRVPKYTAKWNGM